MEPEVREYLVDVYGPDGLPFTTRFGDGDPIGEDVVALLSSIYDAHTVREPWQAGDLMLVDNVRTAHSREPYEGPREVLAAMADPVQPRRLRAHRGRDGPMTAKPLPPPASRSISGTQVQRALAGREKEIVGARRGHLPAARRGRLGQPALVLPAVRRPPRASRIIALPASLGGPGRVDGLKWISSFPDNVAAGLPRASAVLILNDPDTGYPFACLESSIISATRTAASAAAGADWLSRGRERPRRIGFVGTGLIARYIHAFLAATGWSLRRGWRPRPVGRQRRRLPRVPASVPGCRPDHGVRARGAL